MSNELNQKRSVLAIFLFILAIIGILGLISSGVSYGSPIFFGINIVISAFLIYWAYYAKKRAKLKNLTGAKLANFAMYSLAIVLLIEIIGYFILMTQVNSLKVFASENTSRMFANGLAVLRENSTDRLKDVLSEGVVADINKKFADVGAIKECRQEKDDFIGIYWGPELHFSSLEISLSGNYTMRCYGEKKPFDVDIDVKKQNGLWKVDDYIFNTSLEKDFNAQDTNKDEE